MIEVKKGVRLHGVNPLLLWATRPAEAIWAKAGVDTLVVTSGIDGVHSKGSAHYRGDALDLRTNTLAPGTEAATCATLQAALGPDFWVLYEGAGTTNAHCHLEVRPQEPY